MGIAGTNREGIGKYRRFVANSKEGRFRFTHFIVRKSASSWRPIRYMSTPADLPEPARRRRSKGAVTKLSRCHAGFPLILSETVCKIADFVAFRAAAFV